MLQVFTATLQPMLTLFLCIVLGFVLSKKKILPDNVSNVLAKLEVWVFCPALNFVTMARFFTIETLSTNAINFIFGGFSISIALIIAYALYRFFVPKEAYEAGIYKYALTFGNYGYMGDPLILALFGNLGLSYFKIFGLPLTLVCYMWGINIMIPKDQKSGSPLKFLLNAPTVALLIGIIVGLTGIGVEGGFIEQKLPFFFSTLDSLKACMGPVAMILAGCTVARFPFAPMLKNIKVYIATALRLVFIPAFIIGVLALIRILGMELLHISIPSGVLHFAFFATATPLGMNTVVFPEAYGGDPTTGASMAMISHTLCVITIPLMYALMTLIFGAPMF